jgi:hypothetical protein
LSATVKPLDTNPFQRPARVALSATGGVFLGGFAGKHLGALAGWALAAATRGNTASYVRAGGQIGQYAGILMGAVDGAQLAWNQEANAQRYAEQQLDQHKITSAEDPRFEKLFERSLKSHNMPEENGRLRLYTGMGMLAPILLGGEAYARHATRNPNLVSTPSQLHNAPGIGSVALGAVVLGAMAGRVEDRTRDHMKSYARKVLDERAAAAQSAEERGI